MYRWLSNKVPLFYVIILMMGRLIIVMAIEVMSM